MKYLLILLVLMGSCSSIAQTQDTVRWGLQDCIRYALANNIQIQKTVLNQQTSELNYHQQKLNRLPIVTGQASLSLSNGSTIDPITSNFINQSIVSNSYDISAKATLYEGNRLNLQIKKNKLLVEQSKLYEEEAENSIVLDVYARESIHSLSKLMRHLLHVSTLKSISLREEMAFLLKYITLMRVCLTEKTHVNINFLEYNPSIQIAPLLFISLVENAFKHGVSVSEESSILFELEIDNEHVLTFRTVNRIFPNGGDDLSGSGIGVENLKKRLKILYPNQHFFTTRVENNQFEAILQINLNPSKNE